VRFDHAEIGRHQGRRLRLHGCTTVGVQRQLVGRHGMPDHGARKQGFEQGCIFGVFDTPFCYPKGICAQITPANDAPFDKTAAKDVEDGVKLETGPFHRAYQLAVRRFELSPGTV